KNSSRASPLRPTCRRPAWTRTMQRSSRACACRRKDRKASALSCRNARRNGPARFKESHVIDHIGFAVKDFKHSIEFYKRALMPLGITLMMEITPEQSGGGSHAGFGKAGKAYFWIGTG